jgi:hypothetical protein
MLGLKLADDLFEGCAVGWQGQSLRPCARKSANEILG